MNGISAEEQLKEIERGTDEILLKADLFEKLKKSVSSGKPLLVKMGFDPTAPDLHLGHTVPLQKMAAFQRLGHQVVFLIGDFTGLVGDPSGKSKTRPQLSREEVQANAETYKNQVFKILDPKKTQVRFNSEWLDKLTPYDFVRLAGHANVARMLEREDFNKRYKEGVSISLHEFLYPLLQAYDSVALKADVEMGGRDQKFNLLLGRELMRDYRLEPQVCLTMPILEGLDGVQKMGKSLGNYVGINESPSEMYGKLMSIPDTLLHRYYLLLSTRSLNELGEIFENGPRLKSSVHPKKVKSDLACEIITRYHSQEAAVSAREGFEKVFARKEAPQDLPEFRSPAPGGEIWLPKLLVDLGFVDSTSEGKRMVAQGAIKMDESVVKQEKIRGEAGRSFLLQCGKRKFAKIVVV